MKNCKRNGKGKLVIKKGGEFEGEWVKDELIHGTLKLNNGFFYEGEFQKNIIEGNGKLIQPNGNEF